MSLILQTAVSRRLEIEAKKAADAAAFQEAAGARWAALLANYRYVRAALEEVAGTEINAQMRITSDNGQVVVERLPLRVEARGEPEPARHHKPHASDSFQLRLHCVSPTLKYPSTFGARAGKPAEWDLAHIELKWSSGYLSDGKYDQSSNTFAPDLTCWNFVGSSSGSHTRDGLLKRIGEILAPYLPEDLDEVRRAAEERQAAAAAASGGRPIDL